jgi:hypothetical protein
MKFVALFVLLTGIGFAQDQKSWEKPTVQGFSIYDEKLDYSEGFGAYMDLHLQPGTKNFDNGGGSHSYNTIFLKDNYGVENQVYDPFQRPHEENEKVLKEVAEHSFDTATSNSVLNVIDSPSHRFEHIFISCDSLKDFGAAYFKIWEGDRSSKGRSLPYGYQANRPTQSYQEEVEKIFDRGNVVVDFTRHLIIAYKNNGCKEPAAIPKKIQELVGP